MKLMRKICIVLFIILFICSFTKVFAIDMFLNSSSSSTSDESSSIDNDDVEYISSSEDYDEISDIEEIEDVEKKDLVSTKDTSNEEVRTIGAEQPKITSSSNTNYGELTISDIINIILIAVCVVLIFLAIAILIRCKQ